MCQLSDTGCQAWHGLPSHRIAVRAQLFLTLFAACSSSRIYRILRVTMRPDGGPETLVWVLMLAKEPPPDYDED